MSCYIRGDIISVLLDTSFLIAFYDLDDPNHPNAVRLLTDIETGGYGRQVISDYIFDETITLLKKYVGVKRAIEIGNYLLNGLELVHVDSHVFKDGWGFCKKFDKLSFTDCSNLAVMAHYGLDYLVTFDSGFKGVAKTLGV